MMFREVARKKNALSREDGIELLKTTLRGVLSVQGDDGYPYGMPINHWYNEEDGCLYFHGGRTGHKIEAMRRCEKASFCAFNDGVRKEGDWALTFRSVVVFGRIKFVEDRDEAIRISRKLCEKFPDSLPVMEEEIRRSGRAVLCFRLIPEHITAKQIREA